jgi:hypothetical protein
MPERSKGLDSRSSGRSPQEFKSPCTQNFHLFFIFNYIYLVMSYHKKEYHRDYNREFNRERRDDNQINPKYSRDSSSYHSQDKKYRGEI